MWNWIQRSIYSILVPVFLMFLNSTKSRSVFSRSVFCGSVFRVDQFSGDQFSDISFQGDQFSCSRFVDFAGCILGTVSKLAKLPAWVLYSSLSWQPHIESIELLHMIQCCWFGIVTWEAVLCNGWAAPTSLGLWWALLDQHIIHY